MDINSKEFSKLISDIWMDEELFLELKESPKKVLAQYGIEISTKARIEVIRETERNKYLVIPAPPEELMFEEVLENDSILSYCQCQCKCIPPACCCRCEPRPDR